MHEPRALVMHIARQTQISELFGGGEAKRPEREKVEPGACAARAVGRWSSCSNVDKRNGAVDVLHHSAQ